MAREAGDQIVPLRIVLWRRNILLVPERVQHIARRKLFRHKAQLDEGAHTVSQQPVIDLIQIGKVVDRSSLLVFVVDTDLIVKNGVEADVFEIGDLPYVVKIVAIAFAQGEDGASGAEHFLPEMRKRVGRGRGVDDDDLRRRRGAASLSGEFGLQGRCAESEKNNESEENAHSTILC